MVTVVPTMNRGASLANALGAGANSAMNNPMLQQKYQRGQLQEALKNAKAGANQPGQSPTDTLFGILEATAGYPGAERFVGPVYESLLRAKERENVGGIPSPGGFPMQGPSGQSPGIPQMGAMQGQQGQQGIPSQQGRMQTMPFEQVQQQTRESGLPPPQTPYDGGVGRGSLEATELGMGPIPKIYSPDEAMALEQQAASRGLDTAPIAGLISRYNEAARNQANDMFKAATIKADIAQTRSKQQKADEDYVMGNKPGIKPEQLNTFMKFWEKPEVNRLDTERKRYDAANKMYNQYQKSKYEIEKTFDNDFFNEQKFERNVQNVKKTGQRMIDLGERDELIGMLQDRMGLGPVWTDKIVNDLPPQVYKQMEALPSYRGSVDLYDIESSSDPRHQQQAQQERDKFFGPRDEKWKKFLEKTIKPDMYNPQNPNKFDLGTSLVLAREEAVDKHGMPWHHFDSMINELIDEGKIKLGEKQLEQLSMLSLPPEKLKGLGELIFTPQGLEKRRLRR